MTDLGRLEKVELRHVWQTEAQDFTPWLALEDNIAQLGQALGLELEVEAVEQSVGPFRADILCKETSTGRFVLIENQLERTDHTHLGQLMTSAAGLDAVTIVWIAATFADEHRAALDWLKEITANDVRFFGLEVELWRIGESPVAPRFNIVSKPNDWSKLASSTKRVIAEGDLSPTRALQQEYWSDVEDRLASSGYALNTVKAPAQSWIVHGIGRTGVSLNMAMNTGEKFIRVEIYLSGPRSKGYFHLLEQQQEEVEAQLGFSLDWQGMPEKSDARICITREGADPFDRTGWPEQHRWLVEKLIAFHRVFRPVVRDLDPDLGDILS